jgi:D-glycero-D-manno-heptose 1,7-bisphosphate phosphatase
LDRDGVINQRRTDYVKSWDEVVFLPGVFEALRLAAESPLAIVVVTNQSAIGRGIVSRADVQEIHRRMADAIRQHGGRIDLALFCPHRPDEGCGCRKPEPGMLSEAAERLNLDLAHSYLVGDALSDLIAGQAVGCQTALVLTGRGREEAQKTSGLPPDGFTIAPDILSAVRWVLEQEDRPRPAQF